jgi:hypothetical protein
VVMDREPSAHEQSNSDTSSLLVAEYNALREETLRHSDRQIQICRNRTIAIFTDDLFATNHDEANRAAVRAVSSDDLRLAGLALRAQRKAVDAVVKGLSLHG